MQALRDPSGITTRQRQVIELIAAGLSNKEIAARLVISRKTVANHVEHIYAKIGASNRTAAALFATRHGLLTPTASPPGFARAPR